MPWFNEVKKNRLRHIIYEETMRNRQRLDEKLDEHFADVEEQIQYLVSQGMTEENARKQLATLFVVFQKELEEAIKENEEMLEKILRDMVG